MISSFCLSPVKLMSPVKKLKKESNEQVDSKEDPNFRLSHPVIFKYKTIPKKFKE